jgi:hypothetical protein
MKKRLGIGIGGVVLPSRALTPSALAACSNTACGASGFFGHRFGVKRVFQTGVVDGEES